MAGHGGAPATRGPSGAPDPCDRAIVERQLGRPPRGQWHTVRRCAAGAPLVIAVSPMLDDGSRFPTALWLTCPRLVAAVSALESAGDASLWSTRLRADASLARRARAADLGYRAMRATLAGGGDPCASVGIAGQADALAVKCLHARVAAALAGIDDPVGLGALEGLEDVGEAPACDEARCLRPGAGPADPE